jgi:hypothetical protein
MPVSLSNQLLFSRRKLRLASPSNEQQDSLPCAQGWLHAQRDPDKMERATHAYPCFQARLDRGRSDALGAVACRFSHPVEILHKNKESQAIGRFTGILVQGASHEPVQLTRSYEPAAGLLRVRSAR